MQNLSDMLSTYYTLRQLKTTRISTQVEQVHQQIAAQVQILQRLEQEFLSTQEESLAQIRPILAVDARSLVTIPQFQDFVRDLLAQVEATSNNFSNILKIASKPDKWILPTLHCSLQLSDIEVSKQAKCQDEEGKLYIIYSTRILAQLGEWHQVFDIPTATVQDDKPDTYCVHSPLAQWYEAVVRMEPTLDQLPGVSLKRSQLAQELTCLMAYVGDLFNLYSIAERAGL
jgi:hypothetical protein